MSESYGHAYLTSYGWTGSGTGLRKGAIDKPLAIPPKKNLSGLGKDRDEAFPFWDHLFAAASKAITIKVSGDDDVDDTDDPSSRAVSESVPLARTTTGIISNRRPIVGTPASTSGNTTPNLDADAPGRLSLIATAKREAAKRGLYSRFFRGPVLGPDNDPRVDAIPHLAPSSSESPSMSPSVSVHVGDDVVRETKKRGKRISEDKAETKEERRERKRLKKERKVARAAKKAEKALSKAKAKKKKNKLDHAGRKALKQRDKVTQSQENEHPKKARRQARRSVTESKGDVL